MPATAVFYVVQPIPSAPEHIKVGYASNLQSRMKAYFILCPETRVIKTWPCAGIQMEQEAIQHIISAGFEQISLEVFRCPVLADLLQCLDTFFASSQVITLKKQEVPHLDAGLIDLLGQRWMLRIVSEIHDNQLGFRALQLRCDQMSPTVLSAVLRRLQEAGIIVQDNESFSYSLTLAGIQLYQALAPLYALVRRWQEDNLSS